MSTTKPHICNYLLTVSLSKVEKLEVFAIHIKFCNNIGDGDTDGLCLIDIYDKTQHSNCFYLHGCSDVV